MRKLMNSAFATSECKTCPMKGACTFGANRYARQLLRVCCTVGACVRCMKAAVATEQQAQKAMTRAVVKAEIASILRQNPFALERPSGIQGGEAHTHLKAWLAELLCRENLMTAEIFAMLSGGDVDFCFDVLSGEKEM